MQIITDQELEDSGYEICEFGDNCELCGNFAEIGTLFFHRTSYEYIEGYYCCKDCGVRELSELLDKYDYFFDLLKKD